MRAARSSLALAIVKSPGLERSHGKPPPSAAATPGESAEVQRLRAELAASRQAQGDLEAGFHEQLENLVESTQAREMQSKRLVDQLLTRVRLALRRCLEARRATA